jgi:Fur family ferric uptake transcriptional regulator
MSCEEIVYKKLRERGFRITPQREIVLSVLHQLNGPASADHVYQQVQGISEAIDISTVYRTLDLLKEFGIVMTIDPGDGTRVYEFVGLDGPHVHLVCSKCGSVQGVDITSIEPFAAFVRDRFAFELDLEHLSLVGVCEGCRRRKRKPAD